MQKLLQLLIISSTLSFLIANDVWGGISVATPDNLDAISYNPAGLGLSRGTQSGIYIPFDSIFTIYSSSRFSGIGYDLKYEFANGKFPDTFNPSDGNIGIGFALFPNAYAGLKWNKHHLIDLGLLYRPLNQVSLGLTTQFDDELTTYYQSTLGIALRPFLQHRLTIGADILFTEADSLFMYPHLLVEPIDGILLSARTNVDFDDFKINLSFNFGKETIYSPVSYHANNNYSGGIGFYSDTKQKKSILLKKTKNTKHYIRMKLSGIFIEEKPYEPPFNFEFGFNPFGAKSVKGIQLRAWIEDIDKLTEDEDIDGLIIDIGSVRAGMAKRLEIRDALKRFQNTGKEIIVYSDKGIGNKDYFLIAMANEIYINVMTDIELAGLRMQIPFIRGLLDTLSIVPEVFRVNSDGKSYKTAADPIINRKMSSEMRENYGDLLGDWYELFIDGISLRFDGNITKTKEIIDGGPYLFDEDVINIGLADSIMYPDQFDDYINSLNNEKVTITKWKDIDRSDFYIHEWAPAKKDKIAVIYAVGDIYSGKSNPGPAGSSIMGDETIVKSIKSAREDKNVKAIVLRIDSGGGSALASDQMWREVWRTTMEDTTNIKPFIASMSDVAASGGYYIACQADTIIASPATITGSIGVIGLRLNFSELMKRFGINTEWIKMGEHSDFFTGGRLVNDDEMEKIQTAIDDIYTKFKDRVRNGRENISDEDDLDLVAMGRVFTGHRALGNNISLALVDTTGSFQDAIQIAQNAAGLEGKEIEIVEYPQPKDPLAELFNKSDSRIQSTELFRGILPDELLDELEVLDILPVIMMDEVQMILPYHITIE